MTFYIKVKDNRLDDVKFKTFGCGAAIRRILSLAAESLFYRLGNHRPVQSELPPLSGHVPGRALHGASQEAHR